MRLLIKVLGLWAITAVATIQAADLAGVWDLRGNFQVEATVKNTKISAAPVTKDGVLALGAKNNFKVDGQGLHLAGTWGHKQTVLQGVFNKTTSQAFLAVLAADIMAKSGLVAILTPSQATLSGVEQANGGLKGEWLLVGKLRLVQYPKESGVLRVKYTFTGKRQP